MKVHIRKRVLSTMTAYRRNSSDTACNALLTLDERYKLVQGSTIGRLSERLDINGNAIPYEDSGNLAFIPRIVSDAVLVSDDVVDSIIPYDIRGVGPKVKSKWNTRSDTDIIINNDFRWRVTATEMGNQFETKRADRSTWYVDTLASPASTKCGSLSAPGFERLYTGVADFRRPAGTNGTPWTPEVRCGSQVRYEVYEGIKAFTPMFGNTDVEMLLNTLCKFRVDPGPVTATVAEMNAKTWDVAAELGELPTTVRMIYDSCKQALQMYASTKRKARELVLKKDGRNSVEIADAVANLWMTYRYGIQPIAYSVEAALEAIKFKQYGLFQTVRKGLRESYHYEEGPVVADIQYHGRSWMKSRFEADATRFARGIRLDLIPAIWEIAPLSFVTDWFLNVGDVLSAATAPDIARYDKNSYSNKYVIDFEITYERSTVRGQLEAYDYKTISPSEHIGLTFEPALNLKRQLDAAALTWFSFRARQRG